MKPKKNSTYLHSAYLHKSVHSNGNVHARKLQASDLQLSLRLALLVRSATVLCELSHESIGSQYPSYLMSFIQPKKKDYFRSNKFSRSQNEVMIILCNLQKHLLHVYYSST